MVIFAEFIINPRNLISVLGLNCDLSGCITKPNSWKMFVIFSTLFFQELKQFPLVKKSSI